MSFFDRMYEPPIKLGENYPLFLRISIETSSFCNRACSFCPISNGKRDAKMLGLKYMSSKLFYSLIAELGMLRFDGVVQLFLLNEPLLDTSIYEKARALRSACPDCTIYISTNADPICAAGVSIDEGVERLRKLKDCGINVVNLNVYDAGEAQYSRLNALAYKAIERGLAKYTHNKYRTHNRRWLWLAVTDMRMSRVEKDQSVTDMFHRRGMGDALVKPMNQYCARPHRHLVVRYDGIVPVCCAVDPTDESLPILGDANFNTLHEIWNSEIFHKYRWFTQQKRRELPGCVGCTHKMAFPHVVRKVEADAVSISKWEDEVK